MIHQRGGIKVNKKWAIWAPGITEIGGPNVFIPGPDLLFLNIFYSLICSVHTCIEMNQHCQGSSTSR